MGLEEACLKYEGENDDQKMCEKREYTPPWEGEPSRTRSIPAAVAASSDPEDTCQGGETAAAAAVPLLGDEGVHRKLAQSYIRVSMRVHAWACYIVVAV